MLDHQQTLSSVCLLSFQPQPRIANWLELFLPSSGQDVHLDLLFFLSLAVLHRCPAMSWACLVLAFAWRRSEKPQYRTTMSCIGGWLGGLHIRPPRCSLVFHIFLPTGLLASFLQESFSPPCMRTREARKKVQRKRDHEDPLTETSPRTTRRRIEAQHIAHLEYAKQVSTADLNANHCRPTQHTNTGLPI